MMRSRIETTRKTTMLSKIRSRFALPAAVLLALGGAGVAAGSASAVNPDFDFVPDEVHVKALDANDNEVTQAGAHPDRLQIRFGITRDVTGTGPRALVQPRELVKDLAITLPEGLQGNPEALSTCSLALVGTANHGACPADSQVGVHTLYYRSSRGLGTEEITNLYNVDPPEGVVARFAMRVAGIVTVVLDMKVKSDGSYAIQTNIRNVGQAVQLIRSTTDIWGVPAAKTGLGAQVPLLTLGSRCGVELPAKIRANSWRHPEQWLETNPLMPALTGCDRLQFQPTMDVRPTSTVADAPSGYRFRLQVPQNPDANGLATPPLKRAEVLFPAGTAISPGGANGLWGCTDAQAAVGVDAAPDCPEVSRIGSVEIDTPVLDVPLKGGVFLGQPKSQDSQTGEMFRIFLHASAKGVDIKQEGKIVPDPVTGRLRAVFDNTPQQPFEALTVELDGGPGAALVNPATCGTFTTTTTMTSWAGQSTSSDSSFRIDCRPGLGAFLPSFTAGVLATQAGSSSPFALSIGKPDGQAPLSGLAIKLPKGLLANLKGNIGTQVGSVTAFAGSGAAPFQLPGRVFLEGPYGGAPFSLRVVVPATAGPFRLGDVVVRQKLFIDHRDASVTIHSDPIPTILQGVPTRIQRLDVSIDKPGFMISPTSCDPMAFEGAMTSLTGQTAPINARFQVGGCGDLDVDPKLSLQWTGKSQLRKGKHPGVDATVEMTRGQANLRNVKVTLPLTAALDPDNARALCEPDAAKARNCPEASIVGQASATTPTLDVPVSGPVYFVKGTRVTKEGRTVPTLPKLYMKLSGQGVTIDLHADSSVTGPAGKQKLVTTFVDVPDVPIDAFRLKIDSGDNGILKATNDVCGASKTTTAVFTGQNGRVTRDSLRFTAPDCAPQIVSTTGSATKLSVRVGGIGSGRLTLTGSRVTRESRTIRRSDAATLKARPLLTSGQKSQLRQGRTVKVAVKVTFKPSKGKAKTWKRSVAIKGVKRSAR
jgi:hypothetical protein